MDNLTMAGVTPEANNKITLRDVWRDLVAARKAVDQNEYSCAEDFLKSAISKVEELLGR